MPAPWSRLGEQGAFVTDTSSLCLGCADHEEGHRLVCERARGKGRNTPINKVFVVCHCTTQNWEAHTSAVGRSPGQKGLTCHTKNFVLHPKENANLRMIY